MAKYTRLKTPERKVTGTIKKYYFLIHELKQYFPVFVICSSTGSWKDSKKVQFTS